MSTDLVNKYFPAIGELPEAQILDVRNRLETYLRVGWPDLDMRPNSPFGDLLLTPFAYMVAATEEGMGRFMSDLDLENVANGIIYNCDFVKRYLGNFAIFERDTLQSSGVIRVIFNADQTFELDRRTRFNFGNDPAANVFTMRLPHPGNMMIRPVGVIAPAGENAVHLVDLGNGQYAANIPVIGSMTTQVSAGDTALSDNILPEMVSLVALYDFDFGFPPESLSKLAEKTRETYYAASLNSRGGTRRFLIKEFPDLVGISPVLSGDAEMLRDAINPLGISDGRVDVHIRSKGFAFTETQRVRLTYFEEQNNASLKKFIGKLELSYAPYKIDSIVAADLPTVELNPTGQELQIFSKSTSAQRAAFASAAYSELEDLYLVIDMPVDITGEPVIRPLVDTATGEEYAYFDVTYRGEPMLPTVSATVGSSEVAPVGVDVLVKTFIPVIIEQFNIRYIRKPGTSMRLDTARAEILAYINSLAYPNIYTDSKIYDAMFYAGAADVVDIVCRARVQWSVATKFLPDDAEDLLTDYVTGAGVARTAHPVQIINTKSLKPKFVDPNVGTSEQTNEAVGLRNICYVVDDATITFSEVTA